MSSFTPKALKVGVPTFVLVLAAILFVSGCDTGGEPAFDAKGFIHLTILDPNGEPLVAEEEHDVRAAAYWKPCGDISVEFPFDSSSEFLERTFGGSSYVFDGVRVMFRTGTDEQEGVVRCLVFAIGPMWEEDPDSFVPDTVFANPIELEVVRQLPNEPEPEAVEVFIQL